MGAYVDRLAGLHGHSPASEGSYYGFLKELLEGLGKDRDIRALVLPLPDDNGAPDLRVTRGESRLVGYVEVKRPGTDLDRVEATEQLERYTRGYPNLLLTDTWEFRLYRHGWDAPLRAELAPSWLKEQRDLAPGPVRSGEAREVRELLETFFAFEAPGTRSARHLAWDLARKARLLRKYVEVLLDREESPETRELRWLQKAARWFLLRDLPADRFADLYAQTVTYGLFAARFWSSDETDEPFDRKRAYQAIPSSLGLVRRLFWWVFMEEPPEEIRWIVDDLAEVLAATDLRGIFRRYFQEGKGRDPVLHFYETFLSRYDSEKRDRRGVFYTPPEVVSYIVRSAARLLERDFGHPEGLAHREVTVLDPAGGTLTFVVEALRNAFRQFQSLRGDGTPEALRDDLLRRYHAFELMVAPYVIGHLRVALLLRELGCPLKERQSFRLFLADALEMEPPEQLDDEDMALLARDALAALEIKKRPSKLPVILGNPPYAGHSANPSPWIEQSLRQGYDRPEGPPDEGYYHVLGGPLEEKNPKWLQDDYVKFLRLAQWKVDQAGQGLVAFVTNHSYLDNPTFRGMRESLLQTFDRLYLLDLHGNSKKKEQPPDGCRNHNVFDIRQGVAIALLVKRPGLEPAGEPAVFRHDVWGTRREKNRWLEDHDVSDTPWRRIGARPPGFYFLDRDAALEDRWRSFPAVDEIFELGSIGIITGRDALVVATRKRDLQTTLSRFRGVPSPCDPEYRDELHAEEIEIRSTRTWKLESARKAAYEDEYLNQRIERFLVRPFDRRWIAYAPYLLERPRQDVMHHLGGENPIRREGTRRTPDNCALLVTRQAKRHPGAFVTRDLTGHKVLDTYDGNYVFPLYQLPPENHLHAGELRQPNLRRAVLDPLEELYGLRIPPETLLGYVYGVLSSSRYRDTYRELLVTGFPRIPFPRSHDLFQRMAVAGWKLVMLHLPDSHELHPEGLGLERIEPKDTGLRLRGPGSGCVAEEGESGWRYHPDEWRLELNEDLQVLEPIPPEVWELRIGAHRVLPRWLDARRGRPLSTDDLRHLQHTVDALRASLPLYRQVDALYPDIEAEPATLPPAASASP